MGPSVIIFLMPVLAACTEVFVEITPSKHHASVRWVGADLRIINSIDKEAFNLNNKTIKAAVNKYSGRTPTDVFLTRPTPWGDLYTTYKWAEIRRYSTVEKAKVIAVKTEKVTLAEQNFTNNATSSDGIFTADMKADVANSLTVVNSLKMSAEVKYHINLDVALNPPMKLDVASNLDKNYNVVKDNKKIQADNEVKFALKPFQSAKCVLNATKVELYFSIDYLSRLDGNVVTNYYPKYKDHHFWAYDVEDVLKSAKMPHRLNSTVLVSVQYYTNATVFVTRDNGIILAKATADYVP